MELRAVCSERAMTASTASCLLGKGDSAWLEELELRRPFWGTPSIDEPGEGDGG